MASCDDVINSLNNIADKLALNSQVSSPVDLPIARCENGEYSEDIVTVTLPNNLHEIFIYQFTVLQRITKDMCSIEAVAAVPEWWQKRLEGNTPQLVIHFAKKRDNGTLLSAMYPLTIPHYPNRKPVSPPVGAHRKGSYMGMAILKDNSHILCYAADQAEAQRILSAAKDDLSPDIVGDGLERYGPVRGYGFEEADIFPKYAKYFSQGLRNVNPDWTVYF